MDIELRPGAAVHVTGALAEPLGRAGIRARRLAGLCDGVATAAVLGSLFLVPLVFFPYATAQFTVPKATALHYLAVLAVTASALKLLLGQPLRLRRSALDWPILGYLAVVLMGVAHASSKDAAFFGPNERADGLLTLLSAIALYYVAYNQPLHRLPLRWCLRAAVATAGLVALEGIAEALGFSFVGIKPEVWSFRASSTTGNPTFLGGLLVWAVPLGAGLLATSGRRSRPLWALAFGLSGAALFASYSRGPWLGAAAGLVALLLFSGRDLLHRWCWFLAPLAVAGIFAAALSFGLPARPEAPALDQAAAQDQAAAPTTGQNANRLRPSGLERMKNDSTGSGRLWHWQAALEVVRDQPIFGAGYGNLYTAIMRYEPKEWALTMPGIWVDKAHNAYLDHAASLGVPGLLAYLWLLGTFALAIGRYLRRAAQSQRRILLSALLAAMAGYLVHLFFLFDTLETLILFWVLMGLALREADYEAPRTTFALRWPAAARGTLALATLAASAYALYWLAMPVVAQMYDLRASVAGRQHQLDQSISGYLRAAELNPYSETLQIQAAAALASMAGTEGDPRNSRHLLDSALRMVNRSIQRDPENASLYMVRGELYTRYPNGERLRDALADFRRATDMYPNFYPAYGGIADVGRSLGLMSEVVAAERKLLEFDPNDVQVLNLLAYDYSRFGRWREAISAYDRVIELGGDSPGLRLALAQTLLQAGQKERAAAELEKAATWDPNNEQVVKTRQLLQDNGR